MNTRRAVNVIFPALLLMMTEARADPAAKVQIEVSFLLGYVDGSACDFNRNGFWYDARAAQSHLRSKYNYLVGGRFITTTADFINKAATQSSLTGQPYLVRCGSSAPVTSAQWLRAELVRLRTF